MKKNANISPFTIIVAFIAVAIMGIALIPLLPIKHLPSSTLPSMTISFSMPNNSARVVEMTTTSRLEGMLARINGVQRIESRSWNGGGNIRLNFDRHTDMEMARFEASTIIRQTWHDLPHEVHFPTISMQRPDDNVARPFMIFTINATSPPFIIQQYADNNIRPRLSEIPGIYQVRITGATPMEWQLTFDNNQLLTHGITVADIQDAINRFYSTDFLGIAETSGTTGASEWKRIVLTSGNENTAFDASAITIRNRNGALIRLDQLVEVTRAEQPPTSHFRINGLNSITIALVAEEDANQLRLSNQVHEIMNEIRYQLPFGYEIHLRDDVTTRIRSELRRIYMRCAFTILILLVFVFLITRSVRYMFLIVTTVAINLSIAVIFYYLFRLEIQMYTLASIVISLSLIIDNTIIMADHLMHRGDRKVFMPILAATLTSIGALSIIFFLDENIRLNLQSFAAVLIINLLVSLSVALFFVPALMEKIGLKKSPPRKHVTQQQEKSITLFSRLRSIVPSRLRAAVYFSRFYSAMIRMLMWRRWISFAVIILIFGLPVTMLPNRIDSDSRWAERYNNIFNNSNFRENIRPIINTALGGTIRLFMEEVRRGSYFQPRDEMVITIRASLPHGSTLPQMDALVRRMEEYLSGFPEIRQFQTSISNPRNAMIQVFFTREAERTGFPFQLHNNAISQVLQLGGGSWFVGGLPGVQSFSNDVRMPAGGSVIALFGYNFDELTMWADTLRNRLLEYRRINEVIIASEAVWQLDDYRQFAFDLNTEQLAVAGILPSQLNTSLSSRFTRRRPMGSLVIENEREGIVLSSLQSQTDDVWSLYNRGHIIGDRMYRVGELASVTMRQLPQTIIKINQEYRLVLQYDYVGAAAQNRRIMEREVEALNDLLPMGYRAQIDERRWTWAGQQRQQYLLIGLLIIIIFFTSSVLFNSLKQPFAVIFVIPVSFIGVFLTFYLFSLNFDEGGYASFILLSALTVNASIYILNEYNRLRKSHPNLSALRKYLKAWNAKVIPIFLTVVSTMLGFIPFMVGGREGFWFPLAAGTIGGLLLSLVGVFVFLPLMTIRKRELKK